MHGGAKGSGAPRGNQNALKHGAYTKAAFAERNVLRQLTKEAEDVIAKVNSS
jgi:glucans biosynthesis protein